MSWPLRGEGVCCARSGEGVLFNDESRGEVLGLGG